MGILDSAMAKGDINNRMMDYLSEFVTSELGPDVVLNKFVVILETVQPEDRYIAGYAAPGMKTWETTGMLDWASHFESSSYIVTDGGE